jgi:hypothetical protein
MAGSKKRAPPEEELRSYLIGQRISTAASDQLLRGINYVGIHSVEEPDDDKSEFLTVKQEIIGHWKRVFWPRNGYWQNCLRQRLSTFFGACHPDGNISSFGLKKPEPDELADGAIPQR